MSATLEKVTCFIYRASPAGKRLLLFRHPYAGVQIPAGTVEPGETPEQAALREAREESGLGALQLEQYLGAQEGTLPEGEGVIFAPTPVYARPDTTSFNWARLPRGAGVKLLRRQAGFVQVRYVEYDQIPDPGYVTFQITAWAPEENVTMHRRRHFFLLTCQAETPESWTVDIDNHRFTLFWADWNRLPAIISPQDAWLKFLFPG